MAASHRLASCTECPRNGTRACSDQFRHAMVGADRVSLGTIPMRRFAVGGQGGARPLTVPGWLWNGQEWAAFTAAQGGVQRPILLRALRLLRNADVGVETERIQILRRYRGYITELERLFADAPASIQGFPANRNIGSFFRRAGRALRFRHPQAHRFG
jgi:hypothetical protein